jgi:hypothetical protein
MENAAITLPFTDTVVQLAPRWSELGSPGQELALALCGLVPLALVLWLYRHELRLVSRSAAVGLLLLRVAVISLLWFIVCLQPVLTATRTQEVPTRVVVAVDLSGSMTATDPDRSVADKLKLARVLNLKVRDEIVPPELLDDWIAQYAKQGKSPAKNAIQWVKPGGEPRDENKHRQLAERRQAFHDAVCQAVDRLSRREIALRLLASDGGKLVSALSNRHQVEIVGFDQKTLDLTPAKVNALLAAGAREIANGTGKDAATDLAGPLEQGLNPAKKGQGKLIGVVLLSDGRHNAGPAPGPSAEKLGKRKVPVLPIVVGTPFPRSRVSITDVRAPLTASAKNVDVNIRVRFKVSGLKRQKILVKLDRAEPRANRLKDPGPFTIEHNGNDQYYERTFSTALDPDGKPLQSFMVRVVPETKPRTGNLTQEVVVKMDDTQPKVLLVDGEARWEYHYLANALGRDPTLLLERIVFDLPLRDPTISDEKLHRMKNPRRNLPPGPDGLMGYQCIILGDVSPEQLPPPDRQRLEAFVAKHGGTLVIVAGKRSMPLAYPGPAENGKETDPLLKLLPIETPRVVDPEQGFSVTLTREGKSTPFMQMEPEGTESLQRWAEFPPHYWGVVGRAKPAATTLAYFRDPAEPEPAGKQVKEEQERKLSRESALMVRQNYGRGQVLFVGLDSTWRWRYRVGDTYHHRFWGQVVRWAASDYIGFGTERPVYQEGQVVTVRLNLETRDSQNIPADGKLKARIVRLAGRDQKQPLAALVPLSAARDLRTLEGRIRGLESGSYRLELEGADKKLTAKLKEKPPAPFRVIPRDNREMDRLEIDEDLLRDLAARSGAGAVVYTPERTSEIVERFQERKFRRSERSERGLWQEWFTLVIFLGLVTAEWVGRKWAGLP